MPIIKNYSKSDSSQSSTAMSVQKYSKSGSKSLHDKIIEGHQCEKMMARMKDISTRKAVNYHGEVNIDVPSGSKLPKPSGSNIIYKTNILVFEPPKCKNKKCRRRAPTKEETVCPYCNRPY